MVSLTNLENERKRRIRELKPTEIDKYLENLVHQDLLAFEKIDSDRRDYYNDKINELINLHKDNTNIDSVVTYQYLEETSDLLAYHKVKEFVSYFRNLLNYFYLVHSNLTISEIIFYSMIRKVYRLCKETESNSIKEFENIILHLYQEYQLSFKSFKTFFKLIAKLEGVDLILKDLYSFCDDVSFLKDSEVQNDIPEIIGSIQRFFNEREKYENKLFFDYDSKIENWFDDYSEESFYESLFEKYPFLLELDEDSDEYKEKAEDIPSGLLEEFMMNEPQLKLTSDDCEILLPSEVEELSDEMKKRIMEIEEVGYAYY